MKKKGFTLIELLAVIIIMGIILTIAIPNISGTIKKAKKDSFSINTMYILESLNTKMLKDISFDPTIINENNISQILDISNENYESVTITLISDTVHITVVGKGEWKGLTSCGSRDEIFIVEGSIGCV